MGSKPTAILAKIQRRAEASDSDVVYITQGEEVLLDWTSEPNLPLIEIMSIGKSIVALAIGMLRDEGKIPSLDMPLYHLYPEWYQGQKQNITLRMILNHTSGLQTDPEGNEITRAPDAVKLALCGELRDPPGEKFFYNNKATCLLSGIIRQLAEKPVDQYVQEKLFSPLEISEFGWNKDKAGNPRTLGGVQLRSKDLHKIGRFVLQRGVWEGQRLLSEAWLDQMLTPSEISSYKCGLLWWVYDAPRLYAAQGYLGQWLYVLPQQEIIALRQIRSGKRPLDQVDEYKDFRKLVVQLASSS